MGKSPTCNKKMEKFTIKSIIKKEDYMWIKCKIKPQYVDKYRNTLCEFSQSVFFLFFLACKSGFLELELTYEW